VAAVWCPRPRTGSLHSAYQSGDSRLWAAHSIQVLTLEEGSIAALTVFLEPRLFQAFGLPEAFADGAGTEQTALP